MHFLRGTTGTQLGLTQLDGFVLMETQLQPSTPIAMHTHENATIVLILSGEYRESFHGSTAPHSPLTVIAKPAGEKHANQIGTKGARCLVMELTDEKVRELDRVVRPCEAPQIQINGPAARTGLRIVRELRQPDTLTPLALECAALQLVVDLSRQPRRTYGNEPKWMNVVLELLRSSSGEGLRLSTLASAVGVHPAHLTRAFRRTQGCSIGKYARRLQVERVVAILTRTTSPLSDVAIAAGFYDQSHMARVVRNETGMTASQIRAAARG